MMVMENEKVGEFIRNWKTHPIRPWINTVANILFIIMVLEIVVDFEEFKNYFEYKTYSPIIEIAKSCPYGVRVDMCYVPVMGAAFNYTVWGGENETGGLYAGNNGTIPQWTNNS